MLTVCCSFEVRIKFFRVEDSLCKNEANVLFLLFIQVGEDHTGYVHLDKFLPAMTKVLLEHRYNLSIQLYYFNEKEKRESSSWS